MSIAAHAHCVERGLVRARIMTILEMPSLIQAPLGSGVACARFGVVLLFVCTLEAVSCPAHMFCAYGLLKRRVLFWPYGRGSCTSGIGLVSQVFRHVRARVCRPT